MNFLLLRLFFPFSFPIILLSHTVMQLASYTLYHSIVMGNMFMDIGQIGLSRFPSAAIKDGRDGWMVGLLFRVF